jgi:UDP-GlcNAc:undecaprenyl-phosphate GlcNAc-1-phosphate transferase
MRSYLTVFALALLFGLVLTPLGARVARRFGALDHTKDPPIPRGGGPGIAIAAALALLALALIFEPSRNLLKLSLAELGPIYLGGAAILVLGIVDDIVRLKALPKLVVEVAIAVGLCALGVRVGTVWLPFGIVSLGPAVGLLFTVFWITLITNAFNLLDGIDGAAAGAAVFALLALFVTSVSLGNPMVAICAVAVAGGTLGFLPNNLAPARLYLGDAGSLFLGFVLATLSIRGASKGPTIVAIAIPIVAFALPLMDTVIAVIRRAARGAPIFRGDREHLHHRLLDEGLTPRQAMAIIYAVSAGFALASMLFLNPNVRSIAVVLTMIGAMLWLSVRYLHLHEFYELARVAQRGMVRGRAISFNVDVRRAAQTLERAQTWEEIETALAGLFASSEFDAVRLAMYDGGPGTPRREYLLEHGSIVEQRVAIKQDEWGVHIPFQVGPGGAIHGELAVFRRYGRRQLLTDVNLLVEVLRPALAAAAGRVTPPTRA